MEGNSLPRWVDSPVMAWLCNQRCNAGTGKGTGDTFACPVPVFWYGIFFVWKLTLEVGDGQRVDGIIISLLCTAVNRAKSRKGQVSSEIHNICTIESLVSYRTRIEHFITTQSNVYNKGIQILIKKITFDFHLLIFGQTHFYLIMAYTYSYFLLET